MTLHDLLRVELEMGSAPDVERLARAVARRHPGALAVVHYGATLRTGAIEGQLIDFYLIVESYSSAYRSPLLALANRLVPPNVFPFEQEGRTAKYAVLDARDLRTLTEIDAPSVSVWARFSQPIRFAWLRDDAAARCVTDAAAKSVLTMLRLAAPLTEGGDPLDLWRAGLRLTYGAELRAERSGRVGVVLDADQHRYRQTALLGAAELGWPVENGQIVKAWTEKQRLLERRRWKARRWRGKAATLLRLAKASATYGGGIDYLASKVERHSGRPVRLKAWQRRLPLLGAVWLLPSLLRSGAIR